MAKQLGLHKVQGRVGEYSYYDSKNGGSLVRSINQGMSERVKSSKEYANTRRNNAEFAASAACAGAIVRGITSRWRFILNPNATGLLNKAIKAEMVKDTDAPWGERALKQSNIPPILEKFNQLVKNQMPDEIVNFMKANAIQQGRTGFSRFEDIVYLPVDYVNELSSQGATGVESKIFAYSINSPQFNDSTNRYLPSDIHIVEMVEAENIVNLAQYDDENIITDDGATVDFPITDGYDYIGGVLVILLPYKSVGGTRYTLQELCTAYWCQARRTLID